MQVNFLSKSNYKIFNDVIHNSIQVSKIANVIMATGKKVEKTNVLQKIKSKTPAIPSQPSCLAVRGPTILSSMSINCGTLKSINV